MTYSCHGGLFTTCTRGSSTPKLSTLDSSGSPSMKFDLYSDLLCKIAVIPMDVPAFIPNYSMFRRTAGTNLAYLANLA